MLKYIKGLFLLLMVSVISCNDNIIDIVNQKNIILFDSNEGYIYTINDDGTNKQQYCKFTGMIPKYSPNQKKIAFLKRFSDGEWLVILDSTKDSLYKIAYIQEIGSFGIVGFSWSPDGEKIAYNSQYGYFGRSEICTVNIKTKEAKQLTNGGYNIDPSWTPDGKQIYYYSLSEGFQYFNIIDSDGGNNKRIFEDPNIMGVGGEFSPDGKSIALYKIQKDTTVDIYISDNNGNNLKRLTFDNQSSVPKFSPDGKKILFLSPANNNSDLYVMNSDGSERKKITNHGKVFPGLFLWSPDGKKIAYSYEEVPRRDFSIHIVNSDGVDDRSLNVPFIWNFDWYPIKVIKE